MSNLEKKLNIIAESQIRMELSIESNTKDLKYHIKRTDIIENKVQRILYTVLFALGTLSAFYGKEILKLLGILI